jgi:hypothetical protein
LTPNGSADPTTRADDPATASLPVKDTNSSNKFSQIFPAAGQNDSGNLYGQGYVGYYWLSTPYNADNGYRLHFTSSSLNVIANRGYNWGNAIRCVRI